MVANLGTGGFGFIYHAFIFLQSTFEKMSVFDANYCKHNGVMFLAIIATKYDKMRLL